MSGDTVWTVEALHERVETIFLRAGLNALQSRAVSRVIVAAERDDCTSHGIYRIEGALRTIRAGRVNRDAVPAFGPDTAAAVVRVGADGGFVQPALELGLPVLAERARTTGVAALVVNDAVHFSALWGEVEALAAEGLAGIAMCPSYAAVAPTGGNRPLLGTNPFAFAWPRAGQRPYVFDFATSIAARGEIELRRRDGGSLPDGWALDADGAPTTDPAAALEGAMLPFGGHKGSALATMIELLAGVLIGDATSAETLAELGTTTLHPTHGELVLALSPAALAAGRPGDPLARAEHLFEAILGQGARLPSQRRFRARERSEREGISLSGAEVRQLDRFLDQGLDAV